MENAYLAAVRAELLAVYGVPVSTEGLRQLARLAAESEAARLSPASCVEAIGRRFDLQVLPPRAPR